MIFIKISLFYFIMILSMNAAYATPDISEVELSCTRQDSSGPTQMIHTVISFNGNTGACQSSKSVHHEFNNTYQIDFSCENPRPLLLDNNYLVFSWILSASEQSDPIRINKLILIMNHSTLTANGFAYSPSGLLYSVTCKKW